MCVSCGELIGIIDIGIWSEGCLYYYIEIQAAAGAVTIETDNGIVEQYLGVGHYRVYDIPCGESVTIQLINDQDCVSASKTITYNCCGTPCNIQTVVIDTATCDGNRIYSIVSDKGTCDLGAYAIVDSSSPSFVSTWNDIIEDIGGAISPKGSCGSQYECCDFDLTDIEWYNVGDLVTITIRYSPIQFLHLVISGAPCAGNINFTHTNC